MRLALALAPALSLALALTLTLAVSAESQARPLRIGDRVRVSTLAKVTGVVLQAGADSLALEVPTHGSPLLLPWSAVSALAVSEPRTRREGATHGAKWGLLVGAALGALLAATSGAEEEESPAQLALDGVVSGVAIGALVGAIRPGSRWRKLDVDQARQATLVAASPVAPPATERRPEAREAEVSRRMGETPAAELTLGFSAPQSRHAQFPGLALSLAANAGLSATTGVALVADAHAALFRTAVMGGARVYLRTAPLYSASPAWTFFGQVLAGEMRAERSGVVEGTGGFAWQPGFGIDYGSGFRAARLQVDYSVVRDGLVFDDRVTSGPVEKLTGARVLLGITLRSPSW